MLLKLPKPEAWSFVKSKGNYKEFGGIEEEDMASSPKEHWLETEVNLTTVIILQWTRNFLEMALEITWFLNLW